MNTSKVFEWLILFGRPEPFLLTFGVPFPRYIFWTDFSAANGEPERSPQACVILARRLNIHPQDRIVMDHGGDLVLRFHPFVHMPLSSWGFSAPNCLQIQDFAVRGGDNVAKIFSRRDNNTLWTSHSDVIGKK